MQVGALLFVTMGLLSVPPSRGPDPRPQGRADAAREAGGAAGPCAGRFRWPGCLPLTGWGPDGGAG